MKYTEKHIEKNKAVENWWNENPFTLGAAKKDYNKEDLVGRIDFDKMDLSYFQEIERKFRKHTRFGGQEDGMPILSKLVDYQWINGKKVLDIAVGSGFSMVSFVAGGADVTGIDITDFAVKQSKINLHAKGLKGEVIKMDAQKMSFQDASFDFVNAWGCLMHMPSTERAISEIYRVLKKDGKLLAYMYNRSSWPFWFNIFFLRGILLGELIRYRGDVTKLTSRYSDGSAKEGNALTKFYTPKQVKNMFEESGFINVSVLPWELPEEPNHWPMRKFPVFKYLPKKIKKYMAKNWGYGLIVKAEKK